MKDEKSGLTKKRVKYMVMAVLVLCVVAIVGYIVLALGGEEYQN